jgi:hypothetical protein
MMRIALTSVAVAAVLGGGAFSLDAQRALEDFRWSGRVAPGQTVEVAGIEGEIHALPASGSTVEVVGRMHGESLPVRVVEHAGGVTLCVEYPGMYRDAGSSSRCAQSGHVRDGMARVDFTVRVPAGVAFTGRTVGGRVRAEGLRGPVRARTVSGGIDVQTSDVVEASSVSGDVRAVMGRLPRDGSLRFSTVSGDVRLGLPADAGAELRVRTLSGDFDSAFPLTLGTRGERRGRVGQRVDATLGRGGPSLEIRTVSGDVELERNR